MPTDMVFEINRRVGLGAYGRLRWAAKGLDEAAVSGPHGKGSLPLGLYKTAGFANKPGQPPFCDSLNQCWIEAIVPQFSTDRDNLGVHPDGNVSGTEGCIGLLGADSKAWRDAFKAAGVLTLEVRENLGAVGMEAEALFRVAMSRRSVSFEKSESISDLARELVDSLTQGSDATGKPFLFPNGITKIDVEVSLGSTSAAASVHVIISGPDQGSAQLTRTIKGKRP